MFGSHLIPGRVTEKHSVSRKMKRTAFKVIGMDSETNQGRPISFQFYSKEERQITGCIFVGAKHSAIQTFFKHLKKLRPGHYRMYGHHLEFDMLSVLWEMRAKIRDGNIDIRVAGWHITGRYSKPIFANITDGKRTIELVDSILWFQTSLDKAAQIVCPGMPKLLRPAHLGEKDFTASDHTFVDYAMRDAEIAYHLGNAIEKFHEDLEIPSCISLASMAAAIFKRHYMKADIYQPPMHEWMVGAAASYHGGVNRVKDGSYPGWHRNTTALDISSAYPDAMLRFPDFSKPHKYKPFRVRNVRKIGEIPDLGIYKLSGKTAECHWPAIFDHDFEPVQGKFSDIWVSGFEVKQAIEADELSISKMSGYYYDDDSEYSPFRQYVLDFYAKKADKALDAVTRYMYKILLNALTGKFIQTSPDYTLVDGQLVKIMRAGGLYHPMIASLITGHTRSVMHPLEHKYQAVHTATDGIFAPGKHKGAAEKTLGAVVSEGYGDLALFRNKLYIFYTDIESDDTYPSQVFADKHILKCARHGFQGRVVDLEQMLIKRERSYRTNKPVKLKTALREGETPNKFVVKSRNLNIVEDFKVFTYGKTAKGAAI